MPVECTIYRSKRKPGMYVYLPKGSDPAKLPDPLLHIAGVLEHALDLELTEQRRLAREDAPTVIRNLSQQGFHVQMPPQEEDWVVHLPEELLTRNDPI